MFYTRATTVTLYPNSDGRIPMKAEMVEIFHDLILNPWEYNYVLMGSIEGFKEDTTAEYEMLDIAIKDFNVVLKGVSIKYLGFDDEKPEGEEFPGWYVFYKDAFTVFHLGMCKQWRSKEGIHPLGKPKPTKIGSGI
jgi:hypothetical protein